MLELQQLPLLQEAGSLVRRNRHPHVLVPRLHLRDPGPLQGLPLQGSKSLVLVSLTVAPPPVSSQGGASQEGYGTGIVKSSLTQVGVILQNTPTQSQAQSSNEDRECE